MSTGAFVQVRLGSTRLPGKALLDLRGGCLIQHVMRAVAPVGAEVNALLTDAASEAALRPLAEAEGFGLLVGPDEDVLERYCMACRRWAVDRVIRVTGDNPLTSAGLAREILGIHQGETADLSHYLRIPWGSGVEIVEARALFAAQQDARLPDEREHITTFLYRHRDRFRIVEAPAPARADFPDGRLTVDTPQDLKRIRALFEELYDGAPIEIERAIAWLVAHPVPEAHPVQEAGHG
jgi:spore coat polysaccharide biosynthesis protein SpsF